MHTSEQKNEATVLKHLLGLISYISVVVIHCPVNKWCCLIQNPFQERVTQF